ncbi:MAG TPA: type II secretion system protein, partial [Patescibacteria group bacterium]|nr:type II secretion system protein [Patescibacteria group bacterium]
MPTRLKQKNGFTIIELLVVLAIIGIMASIAMASIRVARQKGLAARANADMNTLRTAIFQLEGNSAQFPNH